MAGNTLQSDIFADSAERSLEALLAPYLKGSLETQARLSENDVRQISLGLQRMGRDSWARTPRLYTVLRLVNHVQVIDSFLTQGVSDIWFPFSHKTLPESLRSSSARFDFLRFQDLVITKAFDLEREDGKHRHFVRSDDVPLQKLEELGKGGFGYVDRVLSTITYREYARKLIPRGKTFKKNVEVLRDFERELHHLKKMSHIHIVELVGSYTDPKFVGILMSPVADYNLKDFLARESLLPGERSFLRTFFGCLASAVRYLHEQRVRHKDIKPQNVLVKGHQVFLTDFGISLDWSDLNQSTTTGVAVKTPRYCAPEVAANLPRNSLSDLWSLGCVFLEIWTVLKRDTVNDLMRYLESQGTNSTCYYLNRDSALQWCTTLADQEGDLEENLPTTWIRGMLQSDQEQRLTAQALVDRIQEANDNPDLRYAFAGVCCIDGDDSTDADQSSKRSSMLLEETGASSVGVYEPKSSTDLLESRNLSNTNPSIPLPIRPSNLSEDNKELSRSEEWLSKATETVKLPKSILEQTDLLTDSGTVKPDRLENSPAIPVLVGRSQSVIKRKPVSRLTSLGTAEKATDVDQSTNQSTTQLPPSDLPNSKSSNPGDGSRLSTSTRDEVVVGPLLSSELPQFDATSTQEAGKTLQSEGDDAVGIDQLPPQSAILTKSTLAKDSDGAEAEIPTSSSSDNLEPPRKDQTGKRNDIRDGGTSNETPDQPQNVLPPQESIDTNGYLPILRPRFSFEDEVKRVTTAATEACNQPVENDQKTLPAPEASSRSTPNVSNSTPQVIRKTTTRARKGSLFGKWKPRFLGTSSREGAAKSSSFARFSSSDKLVAHAEDTLTPAEGKILETDANVAASESDEARIDMNDTTSQNQTALNKAIETANVKKCSRCKQAIEGRFFRALDGMFHLDCFTCKDCGVVVSSKFFPIDEENGSGQVPLCEVDYFRRLDLLCSGCGGALRGSYITAAGRNYHQGHFTCSVCPIVIGATDSYYEHDGKVYCHYHYSTQFAQHCTGCQTAILKKFVELASDGQKQYWHPECYMIHKSYDIKLAVSDWILPTPDITLPVSAEERDLLKQDEERMEEKVNRIWSVCSRFEEQVSSCVSDTLTGFKSSEFNPVKKLVVFLCCLLDGLDSSIALVRASGLKEELADGIKLNMLYTSVVTIFTAFAKLDGNERLGVKKDSLISTALVRQTKGLLKIGLESGIEAERERSASTGFDTFLQKLAQAEDFEADGLRVIDIDYITADLTREKSECCVSCHRVIEDECVTLLGRRWHTKPPHLRCHICGKDLTRDLPNAYYNPQSHQTYCRQHLNQSSSLVTCFSRVNKLQQYQFLLKVALARCVKGEGPSIF